MDKKNTLLLTIIAIATLLVAVVGATFAYFTAKTSNGDSAQVKVTTGTTDSLTYGTWSAISIGPLSADNFALGAGDATGNTSGTVTLKANSESTATYCYEAKLEIDSNNFEYTTQEKTPELVISASKNDVELITDQDITTSTSTINIPIEKDGNSYKHTITASPDQTTNDNWSVTVKFKNLDTDQSDTSTVNNLGKTFSGNLKFETVSCS